MHGYSGVNIFDCLLATWSKMLFRRRVVVDPPACVGSVWGVFTPHAVNTSSVELLPIIAMIDLSLSTVHYVLRAALPQVLV
jgi:hypothetical protein